MEDHGWDDVSAVDEYKLEHIRPSRTENASGEYIEAENDDGRDNHHEDDHHKSDSRTNDSREASNQSIASARGNENGKNCDNGRNDNGMQHVRQPIVSRRYDEEQKPRAYYGDLEVSDINATRASDRPMRQWGIMSHQPPSPSVGDRRIFEESLTKETFIQRQGGRSNQVKHVELQCNDHLANLLENGGTAYDAQGRFDNDWQCGSNIPLKDMNKAPFAGDKHGDLVAEKGDKEVVGSIDSGKEVVNDKVSNTILVKSDLQQPMVMLVFPSGYKIVQKSASHTNQEDFPWLHLGHEGENTCHISVTFGRSAVARDVTVHNPFKASVEEGGQED